MVANERQAIPVDAEVLAAAHRRLVADGEIQFDLPVHKPPEMPGWLQPLLEWLAKSGPVVKFIFWAGLATIAALVLWSLYRWLAPIVRRWLARADTAAEPETWQPGAAPARALLAEADALAARGDYGPAAHLLLLRSIEQLEIAHPGRLKPSYTSRDIARAPMLPPETARAFHFIAGVVETSLFAGRRIGEPAWQDCRSAYASAAFGSATA